MRYGGYGMTDGLLDVDLDTYIRTCHMTRQLLDEISALPDNHSNVVSAASDAFVSFLIEDISNCR